MLFWAPFQQESLYTEYLEKTARIKATYREIHSSLTKYEELITAMVLQRI